MRQKNRHQPSIALCGCAQISTKSGASTLQQTARNRVIRCDAGGDIALYASLKVELHLIGAQVFLAEIAKQTGHKLTSRYVCLSGCRVDRFHAVFCHARAKHRRGRPTAQPSARHIARANHERVVVRLVEPPSNTLEKLRAPL
uniref:Uncharacterized protein n=1 Tax=uncultured marine virus TaxID=186617 RepID=A0A0F7L0E7_9VIRU|nr:hypothetical protein [uncultured marine virus]